MSGLDTRKSDTTEELKKVEHNYLEDMVLRLGLSYPEILNKLDIKHIDASTTGYSLPCGV